MLSLLPVFKAWYLSQTPFVQNAVGASALTLFYWPITWLFELRWGTGVAHYKTRNFLHDFLYWIYYRFEIHYRLIELWTLGILIPRLAFMRFDLVHRLPLAVSYMTAFVVFDLIAYWFHRFQHSSRFMWAFHSVHHTQESLSFTTQVRVHPIDRVLMQSALLVPSLILGSPVMIWSIFIVRDFVACLQHAQVDWTFGPAGRFLVSPAFHHIHHSSEDSEQRSNYGVALSIWDHLFGTANPSVVRPRSWGTPGYEAASLWSQLILPFRILTTPVSTPEMRGDNAAGNRAPALDTMALRP